jgi:hypothetical protein
MKFFIKKYRIAPTNEIYWGLFLQDPDDPTVAWYQTSDAEYLNVREVLQRFKNATLHISHTNKFINGKWLSGRNSATMI